MVPETTMNGNSSPVCFNSASAAVASNLCAHLPGSEPRHCFGASSELHRAANRGRTTTGRDSEQNLAPGGRKKRHDGTQARQLLQRSEARNGPGRLPARDAGHLSSATVTLDPQGGALAGQVSHGPWPFFVGRGGRRNWVPQSLTSAHLGSRTTLVPSQPSGLIEARRIRVRYRALHFEPWPRLSTVTVTRE
jgi:hypothetical protein